MRRILFVSHEGTRTGAPMVLLHLLRYLRSNCSEDLSFDVLFCRGGDLVEQFIPLGGVSVLAGSPERRLRDLVLRGVTRLTHGQASDQSRVLRRAAKRGYDVVYANSAASCPALGEILRCRPSPAILHVHELSSVIACTCGVEQLNRCDALITRYIACSRVVQENLCSYGISPARIRVVHEFTPPDYGALAVARTRRELGFTDDTFIVGGCGTPDWRKGTDLFVQLARHLLGMACPRPVGFVWVGGKPGSLNWCLMENDIRKLGLSDTVRLIPTVPDAESYFGAFDVFALTSREDPFPVVCLEAARLGVPVVCFEDATGTTEFVDDTTGAVVPYLDVAAMAEATYAMAGDLDLTRTRGKCIRERTRRYVTPVCAREIAGVIRETLCQGETSPSPP